MYKKHLVGVVFMMWVGFGCVKAIKTDPIRFVESIEPFSPVPEPTPKPDSKPRPTITLLCDQTCTKEESLQSVIIADKVSDMIFGDCFQSYFEKKTKLDFTKDTGAEVIQKLRSEPRTIGLTYFVKKRNPFTGNIVVGFENGDGKIHANRVAWSGMLLKDKVSNVAHEFCHFKGFKHNGNSPKGNEESVPYQANRAVETCFK